VATNFSRLLRHAWVTVGLFLFPGHHTGILLSLGTLNTGEGTAGRSAVGRWTSGSRVLIPLGACALDRAFCSTP